jgi:tetratricopeptide (TPR) repeat protein
MDDILHLVEDEFCAHFIAERQGTGFWWLARRLTAPIGIFLICLPLSAQAQLNDPQTQQDIRNCITLASADEQIHSCSKLIDTFGNKYPTQLAAWLNQRANLFMDKGEYAQAMSDFNEAIRLRPDVYVWYVGRGRLYDTLKDIDHAIADLNESIRLGPSAPDGYYYRGLAREHHGDVNDAISDYHEAVARDRRWKLPQDRLAELSENQSGPPSSNPKFVEAAKLNQTAMELVGQGKYDEAEPIMKQALTITETSLGPINPEVTTALSNLGEIYRRQKNYSEARLYMERALSMAEKTSGPNSRRTAVPLIDLALLDIEEQRFEEAKSPEERLFKILRSSEGTKSLLFSTLIQFSAKYVDKNRCDSAVPLLKEAAQITRDSSDEIDEASVQKFEALGEKCGVKLRVPRNGGRIWLSPQ